MSIHLCYVSVQAELPGFSLVGISRCRGSAVHAKEILTHATPDDPTGLKWLETKTVESGPLVIDNWQKGRMMSLVPNPHAFEPPQLERIILQIVPDPQMSIRPKRTLLVKQQVEMAIDDFRPFVPDIGDDIY